MTPFPYLSFKKRATQWSFVYLWVLRFALSNYGTPSHFTRSGYGLCSPSLLSFCFTYQANITSEMYA